MGGNKLLTDRAHRDGSPSRRSRPEAVKKAADDVVHSEDRTKTNELRKSSSSKKLVGTPMKMLIAEEMSKETVSKRKTSNVVARLMGLDDSLPTHPTAKGRAGKGRPSCVTLASVLHDGRQQEDRNFDMSMARGVRSYDHGEDGYRDVYEVWQQLPRTRHAKDLHRGRCNENESERRMALVRQKFMEAKRLATNEKLLRSKEFEDALEVLSSNRDLFLKFLEEPNSIFSKHLKELHSKPPPPQTKRITVLKPSRTPLTKAGLDPDKPQWSSNATQPTRIVVLKPTVARHHEYDTKPMVIPTTSSSEISEPIRSRDIAKVITCQMRENIAFHRRDESLLSSVLSNGYVADESSFNRSENEYVEEEGASFSDSEIVTPTSRHSWDYVKRYGSPHSLSTFSQAPCSPEPPVITEAKKRLSERCAMVSSHEFNREQMEVRRSSSTLGEVLANSEIKEEGLVIGGFPGSTSRSFGGEEDSRVSIDCMPTYKTKTEDHGETSTCNLSRSKSVPVSSSAYENIGLNLAISGSQVDKDVKVQKPTVPSETAKPKNRKSYFKGKVSRLFFSRSKKIDREMVASTERLQSDTTKATEGSEDILNSSHNGHSEENCPTVAKEESVDTSTLLKDGAEQGSISFKAALFLEKPSTPEFLGNPEGSPSTSGKTSQNTDQPSPTSVLDVPFEDDCSTSNSCETFDTGHRLAPIEEVTRYLSWDDAHLSSPSASQLSRASPKANEENHWHLFVQRLMSAAEFDIEKASTIFTRFYSVDSPLDPTLLDKFLDQKEEDSRSRERRSNLRLVFDCVNYALLDIDRTVYLGVYPWAGPCNAVHKKSGVPVAEEVWLLVRGWVCREQNLESDDIDNGGIVVDREVGRDIGGSGWAELMRSEIDEIGREISGELLQDLVGEALADFSAACFL